MLPACCPDAVGPPQPPDPPWLTVVVASERLILGGAGVEVAQLPQITDAVPQGADGKVLSRERLNVLHLAGTYGGARGTKLHLCPTSNVGQPAPAHRPCHG